jgi:hypothetical protein
MYATQTSIPSTHTMTQFNHTSCMKHAKPYAPCSVNPTSHTQALAQIHLFTSCCMTQTARFLGMC